MVELVAHLAALDGRPALYAARGYGSLFSYCTQALRLSEDAACNRIEAARACRCFPVIVDLLASGEVTLTAVRLLGRHLTPENHRAVLAGAKGRSRDDERSAPRRTRIPARLSVLGRIDRGHAKFRGRSSAWSGAAMPASAPTWPPTDGDAPRRPSWSSTTCRPMRSRDRRRSRTSRRVVGGTTNTKRS